MYIQDGMNMTVCPLQTYFRDYAGGQPKDHAARFLNRTCPLGFGKQWSANHTFGGRTPSSSNLTSYEVTRCASISFSSLEAKKRPGLNEVQRNQQKTNYYHRGAGRSEESIPCMFSMAERKKVHASTDKLMLDDFTFRFPYAREPKSIEYIRVGVVFYFVMCSIGWNGHKAAGRDLNTIGKCKVLSDHTGHCNCIRTIKSKSWKDISVMDIRLPRLFILIDSLMNLQFNEFCMSKEILGIHNTYESSLCMLEKAIFVHPSFWTTVSTSSRNG